MTYPANELVIKKENTAVVKNHVVAKLMQLSNPN